MSFRNTFVIVTFVSLSSFIFFSFHAKDKKRLILTAKIDSRHIVNNINYLLIKATLTNNSLDTFSYETMSCFYPFVSITDSKFLSPEIIDCIKNIPELIKIPPHTSVEKNFRLILNEPVDQLNSTTFRVGVYLTTTDNISKFIENNISPNTEKGKLTQIDKTPIEELIWSNKIGLN